VLRRCYGPEADIWSAGVVAYLLISGRLPFYGATDRDVISAVLHGPLDLHSGPWAAVSPDCRHFIGQMLTRDPSRRPSAEQLLDHPWLRMWGCCGEAGAEKGAAAAAAGVAAGEQPLPPVFHLHAACHQQAVKQQ
jgi:calcium-dependent protein kinase